MDNAPSNTAINKIGERIRRGIATEDDFQALNKWRKLHIYPMNTFVANIRRCLRSNNNIIVAQRLKRLQTIESKLFRLPTTRLSSMQDIGGIRIIAKGKNNEIYSIEQKLLRSKSLRKYQLSGRKDYIKEPKEDGYRGIHLIFEYSNVNRAAKSQIKHIECVGMKVEIQIRTELQHCWATAVEIIDLMSTEKMKYGQGDPKMRSLFRHLSSFIGLLESEPTIRTKKVLVESANKITQLAEETQIIKLLSAYNSSLRAISSDRVFHNGYSIIAITKNTIKIFPYKKGNIDAATAKYYELEADREYIDQVLVETKDIRQLKKAYPNYFSDTNKILNLLLAIIEAKRELKL